MSSAPNAAPPRVNVLAALLALVAGGAWYWLAPTPGPGPGPSPPGPVVVDDLPIKAPGFHCLITRRHGVIAAPGETAVLGSQPVEDACTINGGAYYVAWDHQPAESHPPYYRPAIEKMMAADLPQWCLSDNTTGRSLISPLPANPKAALAEIARIRGTTP